MKKGETMSDKKPIPMMRVPGIGKAQQQPFDISQSVQKGCNACGSELFDKVFRIGIISKLAPGNTLNQDITVEHPIYVCRKCEWELGKEVPEKQ